VHEQWEEISAVSLMLKLMGGHRTEATSSMQAMARLTPASSH